MGGCALVALGMSIDETFRALRRRSERCPENEAQRDFIRTYARASSIEGCVLGAAIGDAMGNPTEFLSMAAIRASYGPNGVEGFVRYEHANGARFAPYTDDTQLAEVVLRGLLHARQEGTGFDGAMRRLASGIADWADAPLGGHRAPGNACLAGARALKRGVPWARAGAADAGGCGSVMRAYPFGLVFADDFATAIEWSVAHSRMTHGDPIALAACAAMAAGTARAVHRAPIDGIVTAMSMRRGRGAAAPPT